MLWNSETAIHFSHFTANYEIEKKNAFKQICTAKMKRAVY